MRRGVPKGLPAAGIGIDGVRLLQPGCSSCQPTNSVRALSGRKHSIQTACFSGDYSGWGQVHDGFPKNLCVLLHGVTQDDRGFPSPGTCRLAALSLVILTAIFQVNLGQLVFIEAKDDGGRGDSWTTGAMSCKAPVKSSPPTNLHPVFYRPDALPIAQPTVSKHWMGKISHSMDLLIPSSPRGLPTLSLTTNSSWFPWGGLPCLSSALWCQYP